MKRKLAAVLAAAISITSVGAVSVASNEKLINANWTFTELSYVCNDGTGNVVARVTSPGGSTRGSIVRSISGWDSDESQTYITMNLPVNSDGTPVLGDIWIGPNGNLALNSLVSSNFMTCTAIDGPNMGSNRGWFKLEQNPNKKWWFGRYDHFGVVVSEGKTVYVDDITFKSGSGKQFFFDDFENSYYPTDGEVRSNKWTGEGDAEIIKDANGNHIGKVASTASATAILTRSLGGKYEPGLQMNFKANVPIDSEGKPVLTGLKVGPDANLPFSSTISSYLTYERIDNMPSMGTGRAWFQFKQGTSKWWYGASTTFGIRTESTGNYSAYIDDVEVYNWDGNLIFKDDFEAYYYGDESKPINLSANGTSGLITLTWKNPSVAVESIQVLSGGINVAEGASLNLAAGAINKVNINVGDTDIHTYDVVMTIGGVASHNEIKGKAGSWYLDVNSDKAGVPLAGWRLNQMNGNSYGGVEIVKDNVKGGDYALKVNPTLLNSDGTGYVAWDGSGMQLEMYTKELKAQQNYKLSFDYKFINARGFRVYYTNNFTSVSNTGEMISGAGSVAFGDWETEEWVFTPVANDNNQIIFSFDGGSDAYWIDNVKLYECDADGNVTGTVNLVVNGSFENELKDVKLENDVISWTQNETDDWDYVNVYLKNEDGSLTLYKKVTDATSLELGAMKSAVENFVVKTVRKGGSAEYTSKGWEVSRSAEYFVSAVSYDTVEEIETGVYEKVTEDIDTIEAGLIMASVELSVGTLDKYSVDAYTALYDNGKLVKIQKASASAVKGETDTLSNIIEVPALDNGVYTIKTFVWTGGTMVSEVTDAGLTE